jgi:hypothetical protein
VVIADEIGYVHFPQLFRILLDSHVLRRRRNEDFQDLAQGDTPAAADVIDLPFPPFLSKQDIGADGVADIREVSLRL